MAAELTPSAAEQGRLWSLRAREWATYQEPVVLPAQIRTFDKLEIRPGDALIDIGCGSAGATRVAATRGAAIAGVDASEALLEIARERIPDGDFRIGELIDIPWPDATFDVVVGFNSFQYAVEPVRALREARRVAKDDARLGAVVWGTAEECEAVAHFIALARLMPPPPPGSPGPLAGEQAIGDWIEEGGFELLSDERVDCPWHYPDLSTAMRALMAAGPITRIVDRAGNEAVQDALLDCLREFEQPDGTYLFKNKFRSLTARAR